MENNSVHSDSMAHYDACYGGDDMKLLIEIPDNDIPTGQSILDVSLHFIDGTVCEASGYGFEVLTEENERTKTHECV